MMLRKIILIVFLGVAYINIQAQYVFEKGNIAANVGIGFISMDGLSPSLNFSTEVGLFPTGEVGVISVGGAMEYKYSLINGQGYNQATIGPRVAWHLHLPFFEKIKFDFYTGIGAGLHHYREHNYTSEIYDRKISGYLEYFFGSRLKLNDNLSLFAEFGDGAIASIKGGFAYHFNTSSKKESVEIPGSKNRYYLIKR